MSGAQRYVIEALKQAGKEVMTATDDAELLCELITEGWRVDREVGPFTYLRYKEERDDTTT